MSLDSGSSFSSSWDIDEEALTPSSVNLVPNQGYVSREEYDIDYDPRSEFDIDYMSDFSDDPDDTYAPNFRISFAEKVSTRRHYLRQKLKRQKQKAEEKKITENILFNKRANKYKDQDSDEFEELLEEQDAVEKDAVESSAPDLVHLLSNLKDDLDHLGVKVDPLLSKVKGRKLEEKPGLLVAYSVVRDHPVLAHLVVLKSLLDKVGVEEGDLHIKRPRKLGEEDGKFEKSEDDEQVKRQGAAEAEPSSSSTSGLVDLLSELYSDLRKFHSDVLILLCEARERYASTEAVINSQKEPDLACSWNAVRDHPTLSHLVEIKSFFDKVVLWNVYLHKKRRRKLVKEDGETDEWADELDKQVKRQPAAKEELFSSPAPDLVGLSPELHLAIDILQHSIVALISKVEQCDDSTMDGIHLEGDLGLLLAFKSLRDHPGFAFFVEIMSLLNKVIFRDGYLRKKRQMELVNEDTKTDASDDEPYKQVKRQRVTTFSAKE